MNIDECRRIYSEAFGVDEEFDRILFRDFSDNLCAYTADGAVASMLFKIPCLAVKSGKPAKEVFYIYAAATDASKRNNGYMTALMKSVIGSGSVPMILKPASIELEGFYRTLGFKSITATTLPNMKSYIKVSDRHKKLSEMSPAPVGEYTLMYFANGYDICDGISFPDTLE